jgi:predicted anti-sigma-YlaC factor YlaD
MRYTCERIIEALSDYFDGDLGDEDSVDVRNHLRGCRACLAFADSLHRIIELCRAQEPGVKLHPLTLSARAELESAWRKALAARQSDSNQESI